MEIISGSISGSFQDWGSFRSRDHFGGCTGPSLDFQKSPSSDFIWLAAKKGSLRSPGDRLAASLAPERGTVWGILGDPGAVRGGGKKIGAKKSQERGEEPLGTEF